VQCRIDSPIVQVFDRNLCGVSSPQIKVIIDPAIMNFNAESIFRIIIVIP